uniref:TIL domain-containing protein n=1 Tax=Globodera rostochiensis TaxID=31243 RepID=A0A914H7G3_GLORO
MPSGAMPLPSLLLCSQILLQLLLQHIVHGFSVNQKDCQANEQFLQCGTCEGSCKEPIIANCRRECKPPRCECQAKNGYVRANDGACIMISECVSYKGIYFGKDSAISVTGVDTKAPKTMLNQFKTAAESDATGGPVQLGKRKQTATAAGGADHPPSIRPPSANRHPIAPHTLHDNVIQTGPSPVIIRPTAGDGHAIGRSRMNLMADVSNAREDTDSTTAAGEERTVSAVEHRSVHSIKNKQTLNSVIHQRSAEMDSSRLTSQEQQRAADLSNNGNPADTFSSIPAFMLDERANEGSKSAVLAKCDERRCPVTTTANDDRSSAKHQQQYLSSRQKLMNKNHPPYLFAYINSPAAVSLKEEAVEVPPVASDLNSGLVDVPQGELHSENAGTDGTWPMSVARDERHLMPAAIPPLPTNLRIFRK